MSTLPPIPTCPEHPSVVLEPKKKGWYCEECDSSVLTYDQHLRPTEFAVAATVPVSRAWPGGLDPATLPTWLAYPWAELCAEAHPRVKLHWLVDTAELVVRWTVAVALAEVVHANHGALPEAVTDAIAEHIERPTLGRWVGVLRALGTGAPAAPVVTDGLFGWATDTLPGCFRAEGQGGTLTDSLLVLRNHVAHGGGVSRAKAQVLVDAHLPTLIRLLEATRAVLGATVVAAGDRVLWGTADTETPTEVPGERVLLVRAEIALPLEPLVYYGPVAHLGQDGQLHRRPGGASPQLYARGNPDRLTYTALGCQEAYAERLDVAAFRALFRLDLRRAPSLRSVDRGFAWDDFLREARVQSEELVGRQSELAVAKAWLKSVDAHAPSAVRIGWVSAGPGVGKSMVVARLAATHENPQHRGLYLHRFRGGDARNSRQAFLQMLQAALWAWPPLAAVTEPPAVEASDGKALEDDVASRLAAIAALSAPHARAPRPPFWLLLDGLDEVVAIDAGLPALLKSLALPGTVWLLAGRPEHGLDVAFGGPGCEAVYPHGLPPMHAEDIRAMLVEGLGPLRYALFARDADIAEGVQNAFVDAVVACAYGLPLYVHLLLEDLRAGQLTVTDESRLPDGLTAYYDDLVGRLGVSDARADLTAIVALLAQATEPLDEVGLALLLGRRPDKVARFLPRVEAALRVGAALVRRAPSPDTAEAWTLYHQSFREYVGCAPALAGSVADARERLTDAADAWLLQTDTVLAPVRRHLFRWGTTYALWWAGKRGVAEARARLTDFAYLQARTGALAAWECTALAVEFARVQGVSASSADFRLWEAFVRERAHLLRRGDDNWSANRILLQLAVEHADDSPVTAAAEAWLAAGHCDWLWLRREGGRPAIATQSACLRVFEGHLGPVDGAHFLPDGRLLSWSKDRTLRLWDGASGAPLATLVGHWGWVIGAQVMSDGRLLSWSDDATLRLWDGNTGALLATLKGHTEWVEGAHVLPDGRVLSWSGDHTLRLWDGGSGAHLVSMEGHSNRVRGGYVLSDGRVLSWSGDRTLRLWDGATGARLATLIGHAGDVSSARVLPDGRLLSWSRDHTLRLWDGTTGAPLAVLTGHSHSVIGAHVLPDGRLLSWSDDNTLRLWDGGNGAPLAVLIGHSDSVFGAHVLPDGRLLSWSRDRTLRLWDGASGGPLATLTGHNHWVIGAQILPDGRLLSWSLGDTLRLWDGGSGAPLATLEGHTSGVNGAQVLPEGCVLSWSFDHTLRLWDGSWVPSATLAGDLLSVNYAEVLSDGRLLSRSKDHSLQVRNSGSDVPLAMLTGHSDRAHGVHVLNGGRLLSWSRDHTLRLWDGASGAPLATLIGHSGDVSGVRVLPDGRLLSWSEDHTLRLWDGASGAPLATLIGHSGHVSGVRVLPDGRVLSWSRDRTLLLWDGGNGAPLAVLIGHSDSVWGAHLLPDGRLLSWSTDGTLRLWDGGSGAPMAVLIGHSDWVEGARVLLDGRLLSWSKDGTLRLWNGRTGASLDVVPKHRARFQMPEIHREWRIAEQPARVRPLGIAEGAPDGRSWHIAEQPARVQPLGIAEGATGAQLHLDAKASVPPVHWHADGDWIVDTLCDEGALELRRGKQSAVLHLHHGRRRVSLEEACRVIDATRTPPFESELADPQVFEDARSQKR